ncbi:MAG: SGNH/GDSL hydrolase family protein [Candidatus Aenigmarchaeota archaeon]|nr:SGNH/GDSL hydrolase family protein [Candidatus Aenigmarchaeota archaeon]
MKTSHKIFISVIIISTSLLIISLNAPKTTEFHNMANKTVAIEIRTSPDSYIDVYSDTKLTGFNGTDYKIELIFYPNHKMETYVYNVNNSLINYSKQDFSGSFENFHVLSKNAVVNISNPVVFVALGDSNTMGVREGVELEDTWPYKLSQKNNAVVVNSGLGGDTISGGLRRLEKDALSFKPDSIIISFGLNDAIFLGIDDPRVNKTTFQSNLERMINRIQADNSTVILTTTTPINKNIFYNKTKIPEYFYQHINAQNVYDEYNDIIRNLAKKRNVFLADIRKKYHG